MVIFRSINDKLLLASKSSTKTEEDIRRLLDKGAEVNVKDPENMATPLHYATKSGRLDLVFLLLKRGAQGNAKTSCGWTPLHYAAEDGRHQIVQLLLEKGGAEVNAKTCYGRTALHAASVHGHKKVIALLLKHGADVSARNFNGSTPLHQASILGLKCVANLLISNGADMSTKNLDGKTPLQLAKDDQTQDLFASHHERQTSIVPQQEQAPEQAEDKENPVVRRDITTREIRQQEQRITAHKQPQPPATILEQIHAVIAFS